MQLSTAVKILKQHEDNLKHMGVQSLFMFGSTVRGDQRDDSDIDLFFDYEKGTLSLFDVMRIRDETSKLLGCEAHMMTRGSINPFYRPYIEAEAIPVF